MEAVASIEEERGPDVAREWLERRTGDERDAVLGSDMVVSGQVLSLRSFTRSGRGDIWTEVVVAVEDCVRGQCESATITFNMIGGFVDGLGLDNSATGSPPLEGAQYLFWLRADRRDPTLMTSWGAQSWLRVEGAGDWLPRKGMTLDELLELVREYLEPRHPEQLALSCDAVMQGTVMAVEFKHKRPPVDWSGPHSANFIDLLVEEVGRGELQASDVVRVDLPYKGGGALDVARFVTGERVVVFLAQTVSGGWSLAGGRDARIPVNEDGGFGEYFGLDGLMRSTPRR